MFNEVQVSYNLTYVFVNINSVVLLWRNMTANSVSTVLLCLIWFINTNTIMTMTIIDNNNLSLNKNTICHGGFSYNCWVKLGPKKYYWFTKDPGALYNKQNAEEFCRKLGAHLAEFEDSKYINVTQNLHQKHSTFEFWMGKPAITIRALFYTIIHSRLNTNRTKWQWQTLVLASSWTLCRSDEFWDQPWATGSQSSMC